MNIKSTSMKKEDLDRLLEKYYEGSTTLEEELLLKEFFVGTDIPEGYDAEKMIFGFYAGFEEPSNDLDDRILSVIINETRNKSRRIIYLITSAAASVIIITGLWIFLSRDSLTRDTYTDPEIAYAETMKILFDISFTMNRATSGLEPVSKMNILKPLNTGSPYQSTSVSRSLKSLEYMNKALGLTSQDSGDINK